MSRRAIFIALTVAVLLQLAGLAGGDRFAVDPLWSGREVRLVTVPVDPRSLFRRTYARLRYAALSDIETARLPGEIPPREGEVVYVRLKPNPDGTHGVDGILLSRPEKGLFLRGRLHSGRWRENRQFYTVRCGIEAWFAPRHKALAAENRLRRGGIALVMVAPNGKAALKGLGNPSPPPG